MMNFKEMAAQSITIQMKKFCAKDTNFINKLQFSNYYQVKKEIKQICKLLPRERLHNNFFNKDEATVGDRL